MWKRDGLVALRTETLGGFSDVDMELGPKGSILEPPRISDIGGVISSIIEATCLGGSVRCRKVAIADRIGVVSME